MKSIAELVAVAVDDADRHERDEAIQKVKVGRLEILPILILFNRESWRR